MSKGVIFVISGVVMMVVFFVVIRILFSTIPVTKQIEGGAVENVIETEQILQAVSTTIQTDQKDEILLEQQDDIAEKLVDVPPASVIHYVPFTPQAPFGDWSDFRQQDGCEEASVLMAWKWSRGEGLTRQEALSEIIAMSEWESRAYGGYRDTSAYDTYTRLLREYFGYIGGRVEYDISIEDIKREIQAGNVLIVPLDGQILKNPNFTSPGPERHMLVVVGYDDEREVFVTNDPGTRMGERFVYTYENFEASLRDYETGDHVPIVGRRSAMIVVNPVKSDGFEDVE